jgi:hypothetical protein
VHDRHPRIGGIELEFLAAGTNLQSRRELGW